MLDFEGERYPKRHCSKEIQKKPPVTGGLLESV
jgi:hypothetical protein